LVPKVNEIIKTGKEIKTHTIRDFLQRPIVISSFDWNSSSTFGTLLATYDLPNEIMRRPVIAEKLQGFAYFRASTCFKIQVNATPFMQGRLLAVFVPYGGKNRRDVTALQHLGGVTGYPHVDLDLSHQQCMSLKIPFVSPLSHLGLVRGYGTIGQLRIYAYAPLAAAEAVTAEVTTWGWFEDVEVEVPTGLPLSATFQSAEGSVSSLEQLKQADPLPWERVCDLGKGEIKPTDIHEPNTIQPSFVRTFANGEGVDTSKTLSLSANSRITPITGKFGTSVDEMDLGYIARTPTYFGRFNWSTSHASGTQLDAISVHPMVTPKTGLISGTFHPTTLAYISSSFRFWSGSLIFTFKFVKTKFHSGRLRFTYVPSRISVSAGLADPDKCYSQVFDLRESNEFEFRIPYTNVAPWARVGTFTSANYDAEAIGQLIVTVLNQLKAPSVCSSNIDCVKEIRGGDDFALAAPSFPQVLPLSSAFHAPSSFAEDVVDLQGFEDIPTRDEAHDESDTVVSLFPTATLDNENSRERMCIGEKVDNLRSLLRRNCFIGNFNLSDQWGFGTRVNPYYVNSAASVDTVANDFLFHDYYSYFSFLFAFQCGGMRLKLLPLQPKARQCAVKSRMTINQNITNTTPLQAIYTPVTTNGVLGSRTYPRTIHFPNEEGMIEVEVPQYWQTPIAMTAATQPIMPFNEDPSNFRPSLVAFEPTDQIYATDPPVTTWKNYELYRSVANDFEFGFLIGAPIVTTEYDFTPTPPPS
jgi:hypothetical protein